MPAITLGATFINNHGDMLPNYTRSTQESAVEHFPTVCVIPLDKFKDMGGRLVNVLMIELDSRDNMVAALDAWIARMNQPED